MRYLHVLTDRLAMLAVTGGICFFLESRLGVWAAIAAWGICLGIVCAGLAFLMSRQGVAKITPVNRFAGVVMPFGYQISQGKLRWILGASWAAWMLLGISIIALLRRHGPPVMGILLLASWIIDGAVVMRLATLIALRTSGHVATALLLPLAGFGGLLAVSFLLAIFGHAGQQLALLLSGGPIVVVGGAYGVVSIFLLIVGKHTRWN